MLGWIGDLFIVAGLWDVGNRARRGFLFSAFGESAWIANACLRSDWALTAICVVFLLMAIRNYVLWGRA